MAFSQELVERISAVLEGELHLTTKQMFGGLSFFVHGNIACGVIGDELIVRIQPDATGAALGEPHVHAFNLTGRTMQGWIVVEPAGIKTPKALARWVRSGVDFALTLPAKDR